MSYIIKIVRLLDKYIFGFLAVIIGLFSKLNCKKSSGIIREAAFIKLWAIGDSVTTLPLIKKFKEVNKKAKITLIVTKRNIDVYKEQKFIDKIILLDINKIFEIVHLFKKYDLVFDLEPYLNISALLSWFIGKHRIGFSKQIRSIVYNERIPFSKDKHIVNIYLQMIESFSKSNVTSKLVKLELTNNEKKIVNDFLLTNKITTKDLIIGVCPGAAESVKERMWPQERFVSLANNLIKKYNAKIIFIGSPDESKLIEQIKYLIKDKTFSSAGKLTLRQTFYLVEKCKIFISNDTGPMHIAVAQGCKTIGLFGPNTPTRWAPFGKDNISIYHKIHCSPCIINEKGIMPTCVNKEFQKCMKLITVEKVCKAVEKLK